MTKCYYADDKKHGKVLIPGCWPVVHSNDKKDCTCNDYPETHEQFEKKEYNEVLQSRNKYIKELEDEISILNKALWKH